MKTPLLIHDKADIHDHVKSLWRTEPFRRSYEERGLVYRIADRFARLPRFFFDMSDEYLEKAHFSIWWSGLQYREYDKGSCNDLHLLHEMAHGADMIHVADQHADCFKRKMLDNELFASTVTEIMVYFDMPDLRALTFPDEIFADRFLKDPVLHKRWREDPDRLLSELYYRRRGAMFHPAPGDAIEQWLHGFTMQNDTWFNIWAARRHEVEARMEKFTHQAMGGDRRDALASLVDWLAAKGSPVPFPEEAAAFAAVYWRNRGGMMPGQKAA